MGSSVAMLLISNNLLSYIIVITRRMIQNMKGQRSEKVRAFRLKT